MLHVLCWYLSGIIGCVFFRHVDRVGRILTAPATVRTAVYIAMFGLLGPITVASAAFIWLVLGFIRLVETVNDFLRKYADFFDTPLSKLWASTLETPHDEIDYPGPN